MNSDANKAVEKLKKWRANCVEIVEYYGDTTSPDLEASKDAIKVYDICLEALTSQSEWQPMETAPKDGSIVWCWQNGEFLALNWSAETDEYDAAWVRASDENMDECPEFWLPNFTPPPKI